MSILFAGCISSYKKPSSPQLPDQYFNNVSLLLHMNGANGGSVFTDNSPRSKTANFIDNPITRTDKFKFPPSSFFGDTTTSNNGSAIWFASNPDFGFGTGEFTIEFFINTIYITSSRRTVMSFGESTGSAKITIYAAKLEWFTYSSYVLQSTDIANGAWRHVAITRKNSTYYLFIDGKKVSESATAGSVDMPANLLIVGAGNRASLSTRSAFPGWLDDIRITKGVARYTADFTPPTEPFPDS
jgi:hypothetical protein